MVIYFDLYDIIPEMMMLFLSVLMLVLIATSKPEMTRQMRLCTWGFILSVMTILFENQLFFYLGEGSNINRWYFNVCYVLFVLFYVLTENVILVYLARLSYDSRSRKRRTFIVVGSSFIIFLAVALYPLFTNQLLGYTEDGRLGLRHWYFLYAVCGLVVAAVVFIVAIVGRREISRIVTMGTMIGGPITIATLLVQIFYPRIVFTSCTFVLPLVLFYLLFHCATYDEIVGAQHDAHLYSYLDSVIKNKEKYVLVYTRFPSIQKQEFSDMRQQIYYAAAKVCRRLERARFGVRIYTHNIYTYMLFAKVKDDKDADDVIEKLKEVLSQEIEINGVKKVPECKLVIIKSNDRLDSSQKVRSLINLIIRHLSDLPAKEQGEVTEEHLEKFEDYYFVEQEILDIRDGKNLDDERVICFAQPIYSIAEGAYRTAEALMRMELNGKTYYPDYFIPAAENNNCIHMLTLIMLNKVCKQIKSMEGDFDFDAITVNCCTEELEKRTFCQEVMDLIEANGVDPSYIRIEITESVGVSNYDNILYNMKKLNEFGVKFYLDDFGTGYSNLERLITYPFMTIKFDKSIFYKAFETQKADKLLTVLVDFFVSNGFHALVEGVEDSEQSEYAKQQGFEFIQGYHYSKPRPIEELTDFFSAV